MIRVCSKNWLNCATPSPSVEPNMEGDKMMFRFFRPLQGRACRRSSLCRADHTGRQTAVKTLQRWTHCGANSTSARHWRNLQQQHSPHLQQIHHRPLSFLHIGRQTHECGCDCAGKSNIHKHKWWFIGWGTVRWPNDNRGVGLPSLLIATQEAFTGWMYQPWQHHNLETFLKRVSARTWPWLKSICCRISVLSVQGPVQEDAPSSRGGWFDPSLVETGWTSGPEANHRPWKRCQEQDSGAGEESGGTFLSASCTESRLINLRDRG